MKKFLRRNSNSTSSNNILKIEEIKSPDEVESISVEDHHDQAKSKRNLFFNVSLSDVYIRDQTEIPRIVTDLCELIIEKGINVLGLFREKGNVELMQKLKDEYNQNGFADLSNITEEDVMACADLLKLYLRELPQPIVSKHLQDLLKEMTEEYKHLTKSELTQILKFIFGRYLSTPHYNLLKYISEFSSIIAGNSKINRMNASNLSIVLSANICQCGDDLDALNLQELMNYCFCIIFENHAEIFSEFVSDEKPAEKPSSYVEYCYDKFIEEQKEQKELLSELLRFFLYLKKKNEISSS